jgi:hypothetical protein
VEVEQPRGIERGRRREHRRRLDQVRAGRVRAQGVVDALAVLELQAVRRLGLRERRQG